MYQGRSNRADTEDAHGDEIQNDGEDDQSDELQAKAAFQHIFQLDFAGAISNGVGGRSGRQHESKVAGQHAGDHHGKGTDSDSLAHTGQDRDKGGHDHGVGSQFSENSGDNTNQNYNQDGVHARQAGEHIGDPLRALLSFILYTNTATSPLLILIKIQMFIFSLFEPLYYLHIFIYNLNKQ